MESIGEKLRSYREEKGYSLDQVARDTHITKRFLEALEQESFSSLPGESYVVGFLRSYSDYLGLDAEEMVTLYRNLKLQEQPAPMSQLLERPRISGLGIGIIAILVVAVFVVGGFIIYSSSQKPLDQALEDATPSPSANLKGATMAGNSVERSFAVGETLIVNVAGQDQGLTVGISNGQANLLVNGAQIALPTGQESLLDLNQDGKMDLRIVAKEVNDKATPQAVVLSFNRVVQSPQGAPTPVNPAGTADVVATAGSGGNVGLGTSNQPSRLKQIQLLSEYLDRQQIAVTLRFDGSAPFRYEIDGARREERLSGSGEVLNLSGTKSVRMWFSNGARVTIKVGNRELKAGAEGEVSAWALVWTSENADKQLSLVPMY